MMTMIHAIWRGNPIDRMKFLQKGKSARGASDRESPKFPISSPSASYPAICTTATWIYLDDVIAHLKCYAYKQRREWKRERCRDDGVSLEDARWIFFSLRSTSGGGGAESPNDSLPRLPAVLCLSCPCLLVLGSSSSWPISHSVQQFPQHCNICTSSSTKPKPSLMDRISAC